MQKLIADLTEGSASSGKAWTMSEPRRRSSAPEDEDDVVGDDTGRPASLGLTERTRETCRSSWTRQGGEAVAVATATTSGGDDDARLVRERARGGDELEEEA